MSLDYKPLLSVVVYCMIISNALANPKTFYSKPKQPIKVSGKVVETMNAGGYTYVGVQASNGEIVWAAGPKTDVLKGQSIVFDQGTVMRGFKSPTLNRTFKTIYFTSAFQLSGKLDTSNETKGTSKVPIEADSKVAVTSLANGYYTVEQLFTKSSVLSGKEVSFRGKVVKFNAGIMGKNWLHIQDGSGTMTSKTNDITVTTDGNATVGDDVKIKGTLVTNKDFGAGYRYTAIIENASVTKE